MKTSEIDLFAAVVRLGAIVASLLFWAVVLKIAGVI